MNLLQADNSTLTTNDWTLLTNLIHNYNEGNMSGICQRWIDENRDFHRTYQLDQALTNEFFQLLYQTTEMCLRSNGDICALPFDDRSISLRPSADSVTCFGGPFLMYQYQLNISSSFLTMLRNIYGENNLALTLNSLRYVDLDQVLLKMVPLLLVFSSHTSIFRPGTSFDHTNSRAMFHIQNRYVEVAWKYLLYRYDSREAIQKFLRLVRFVCSIIELMAHLQCVQSHVDDIDSLVENTEIQLILDDVEKIDQTIEH